MLLVKLGGSAITVKGRVKTLRRGVLGRLARELSHYKGPIIVVHGAGSFGHKKVSRHGLDKGLNRESAIRHSADVHADVRELNLKVLRALQREGINAFSMPPSLFVTQSKGKPRKPDLALFGDMMFKGFTPVTFGDIVPDDLQGTSICSGDTIMLWLAERFSPSLVVFVTDVDGIFDADPKKGMAKLIRKVNPSNAPSLKGARTKSDVTGAMPKKLETALAIARTGVKVIVLNGLSKGRLQTALDGRKGVWTEVG